jgi:hypothetical protein
MTRILAGSIPETIPRFRLLRSLIAHPDRRTTIFRLGET